MVTELGNPGSCQWHLDAGCSTSPKSWPGSQSRSPSHVNDTTSFWHPYCLGVSPTASSTRCLTRNTSMYSFLSYRMQLNVPKIFDIRRSVAIVASAVVKMDGICPSKSSRISSRSLLEQCRVDKPAAYKVGNRCCQLYPITHPCTLQY